METAPTAESVVELAVRTHNAVRVSVRSIAAAVLVAAALGSTVLVASLDDRGAQQVEAELSSPVTLAVPQDPERSSARSRLDRDALIVEVSRLATVTATGTEPRSTGSPESFSATSSTPGVDGDLDSPVEPAAAAGIGPPDESSRVTGPPSTARRTVRSSPANAAGSSSGPGPTSTAAGPAPSVTPPATTTSNPTSSSTSTSTATSRSTPTSSSTSASTSTPTATATEHGVVWEEHFDGLDTGRWRLEHSTYGDGNGERQCYQPDNVRVANGLLILTARAETATCPNGSTRSVTSGMVRSRGLTFSPGQGIEFRVKLTPPDPSNQAGLWPAVWASSWAGSWPRGGELDFLEVMTAEDPRRAMFSMHYADRSGGHELQNKAVPLSGRFSDGWHTVRFDYGRHGNLAWFLDGSPVFSVSAAETAQGYPAPFDQTIHEIKLNLAVGGSPGPLAAGVLGSTGATFEIDYIKVFDLEP